MIIIINIGSRSAGVRGVCGVISTIRETKIVSHCPEGVRGQGYSVQTFAHGSREVWLGCGIRGEGTVPAPGLHEIVQPAGSCSVDRGHRPSSYQ